VGLVKVNDESTVNGLRSAVRATDVWGQVC